MTLLVQIANEIRLQNKLVSWFSLWYLSFRFPLPHYSRRNRLLAIRAVYSDQFIVLELAIAMNFREVIFVVSPRCL
jgi:hypothetical protein